MIKTVPHGTVSPQMMYKKYKRLVYTSPDLLARFCKINCKLVERRKLGLICSPRICFPGLILLHQKFLQFDWLRAVVFQLNLKYLHVKITNLLWVVV